MNPVAPVTKYVIALLWLGALLPLSAYRRWIGARAGKARTMQREDEPDLATREERAAAAEAAAIGGGVPDAGGGAFDDEDVDEAMRPVYEAGGGEQDGF